MQQKIMKSVLSLDAILFTTLIFQYLVATSAKVPNSIFTSLIIFCVFVYLLIDHYSKIKLKKTAFYLKTFSFLLVVFLLIYVPAFKLISGRQSGQEQILAVDGAIMLEEATKKLLQFKNPYTISYKSVLENWPYNVEGVTTNPAFDHFAYLPAIVLINAIGYVITMPMLGTFDTRIISLIFLTGTLLLIFKFTRLPQKKLMFTTLFLFNPIFLSSFLWGLNDIYLLFFTLLTAYLLKAKRFTLALVSLAIACSIKLFAWPLVPFVLFYLYNLKKTSTLNKVRFTIRSTKTAAILFAIIVLPFIIASPKDFFDDIFVYSNSQTVLGGYGFSGLLYYLNIIKISTANFPFIIFQLLVNFVMLIPLLRLQRKNNSIGQVLFNYAILLLPLMYFGRNLNHNYLAYFSQLVIITFFVSSEEHIKA